LFDHLDGFLACGLGGLFEVKLRLYGDYKYIVVAGLSDSDQGLEDLFCVFGSGS
jgi:hypothetical protein